MENVNQTGAFETVACTVAGRYRADITAGSLKIREAETGIEQQSVEGTIDRAFTDDF